MDIGATLDWLLSVQRSDGNIASKVEEVDVDRGENQLVQWCHGATGAVHLFIVAFIRFGDDKYLKVSFSHFFRSLSSSHCGSRYHGGYLRYLGNGCLP